MRNKYKNAILKIIEDAKFSRSDFSVFEDKRNGEYGDYVVTSFKYKNSPFIFEVRISSRSFEEMDYRYVQYGPSFEFSEFYPESNYTNFDNVESAFYNWLYESVKEYEEDQFEPDLWADYENGQSSVDIGQIDFNDKSSFSIIERKQVQLAINEVKYLIEKYFSPVEEQLKLINERLEYLTESTENLNKFDWKSLLFSTIIGIATTLTLDTEKGKALFDLFKQVFSSIKLISK